VLLPHTNTQIVRAPRRNCGPQRARESRFEMGKFGCDLAYPKRVDSGESPASARWRVALSTSDSQPVPEEKSSMARGHYLHLALRQRHGGPFDPGTAQRCADAPSGSRFESTVTTLKHSVCRTDSTWAQSEAERNE
jgi:hypothetical protein